MDWARLHNSYQNLIVRRINEHFIIWGRNESERIGFSRALLFSGSSLKTVPRERHLVGTGDLRVAHGSTTCVTDDGHSSLAGVSLSHTQKMPLKRRSLFGDLFFFADHAVF